GLAARLPDVLPATEKGAFGSAAARLEKEGVPHELAARCAAFEPMFYALDIVEVAHSVQRDIEPVARLHFALAGELDFPWIRARIGALPPRRTCIRPPRRARPTIPAGCLARAPRRRRAPTAPAD